MKYRAIIELVLDASNQDDAKDMAGEYLKGELDFGVEMKCKACSLLAHRTKKIIAISMIAVVVMSTLLLKGTNIGEQARPASQNFIFDETSTVLPELKTKHKADFKSAWSEKREEAILRYLKK